MCDDNLPMAMRALASVHGGASVGASFAPPTPPSQKQSGTSFAVGDEVEVGAAETWFRGRIEAVRDDGTFDVQYHDGDRECALAAMLIRAVVKGNEHSALAQTLTQLRLGEWLAKLADMGVAKEEELLELLESGVDRQLGFSKLQASGTRDPPLPPRPPALDTHAHAHFAGA